ncbi:MAG: hypothetical protein M0033_13495 [Nitrospiraceae bacterium]|nr:hypothetical protein [Nitrospiraceae bacterium]
MKARCPMKTRCLFGIALVLFLALHARISGASQAAGGALPAAGSEKRCLTCHGKEGPVLRFPDGEVLKAYVDPGAFGRSAHRSLGCSGCHLEFKGGRHPNRFFRSEIEYRVMESGRCLDCHPEGAIGSRGPHAELFKGKKSGKPVICTDCHSAHSISAFDGGHGEESYCLACHRREEELLFSDKQAISIRVSLSELSRSPHKDLACSDCHFGFSAEDHPRRMFGSKREYMVSSARMCRRCHFDKYASWAESVHYSKLDEGMLGSATCVDCHGGHAVVALGANRPLTVSKCAACHAGAYRVYAGSVHGKALLGGNADVPICTDCHSSHRIQSASANGFHDSVPEICAKCHGNAAVMGRYGLSAGVVKTYLADFHGLTLSLYRKEEAGAGYRPDKPMAVCTDCHGAHDIASVTGADIRTLKLRLLGRCRRCHPNATVNFPGAWLSHYEPSLKVAPVVFIVALFYKIITPLMILGLLIQIILQVWRYLANR